MEETKIRYLRKGANISQRKLSLETGIPAPILSLIENRKLSVFPKYKKALAAFFNVEPESLVDDQGMAAVVDE